ncbi:lytic murein transglycosylase [Geminicoccus harenae]|uniref:lytic murein transglycosylase n=2 Tax=Geminicoccus harenae TaxID=2498453 RepID=UPI001C93B01B|nr:lytic murein transglycosylase [Geminicoccus harenae]
MATSDDLGCSRRTVWQAVIGTLALLVAAGRPRPVSAAQQSWPDFLDQIAREARRLGISPATTQAALARAERLERVIELDRRQPEGRMSFADYIGRVIDANRVRRGQEMLATHWDLLEQIRFRFGVPNPTLVALWGLESSYGRNTGSWSVVSALATLAHEGRRSEFFRGELMAALQILDAGDVGLDEMTGSWAGAMGQAQFMPSTYLRHAVDWDGDGQRDIWGSVPDVFASMSNLLARSGWRQGELWGREVQAPADLPAGRRDTVAAFAKAGVRDREGGPLPNSDIPAVLLRMDGPGGRAFLTYHNFQVIKIWNRSDYFALSVGLLSDQLKAA